MTIRLGFLASGGGTSVEALTEKIKDGRLEGFEAVIAMCNLSRGRAGVYQRADRLGLEIRHTGNSREQLSILKDLGIDMILGLGYLKKVGDDVLDYFQDRAWNIHPALLPRHGGKGMYGLAVHKAVIESGDEETGATVHVMNSSYDKGPILNQVRVPVFEGETPEMLQRRILPFEYDLMASTLGLYRDGLLSIVD